MFTEEWNMDEAMKVSKEEGKIEGKIEGTIEAIKNLMKNTKCSAQNAMTNLGISPNEFSKYMAML